MHNQKKSLYGLPLDNSNTQANFVLELLVSSMQYGKFGNILEFNALFLSQSRVLWVVHSSWCVYFALYFPRGDSLTILFRCVYQHNFVIRVILMVQPTGALI